MGAFQLLLSFFLLGISFYIIDNSSVKAEPKKKSNKTNTVFVDIKGAVKSPGVYEVSSNSRIIDVIEKAGDLKKNADTSIINLSKKVKDEMYIIIYTKDEISSYKDKMLSSSEIVNKVEEKIICPDSDNDGCINKTVSRSETSKININTASISELTKLTGIGEGKAKKIIEYRKNNKFEKIEDIKNVSGIGNSLYEKIKEDIEI
ncbi:MAG: helix-hairpin-helix domain-containing protein [Bacilli bacterium]|nr:helix-hairpin-helix domain-containing protein [Bacilli bacterium]